MYKFFFVFAIICIITSCQKQIDDPLINTPHEIDTSLLPVPASFTNRVLIKQSITKWTYGGIVQKDSAIVDYKYDDRKFLISQAWNFIPGERKYLRDSSERIYEILSPFENGAKTTCKVYYKSSDSRKVNYVISQSVTLTQTLADSIVFEYDGDHVVKTSNNLNTGNSVITKSYTTYKYDMHGNITEIRFFHEGEQFNLGYSFEYDNKINPTYSLDDARLFIEGAAVLSPNNAVKQTNHWGEPPARPDDYINVQYNYLPNNLPKDEDATGTALDGLTQNGPLFGSYHIVNYYY